MEDNNSIRDRDANYFAEKQYYLNNYTYTEESMIKAFIAGCEWQKKENNKETSLIKNIDVESLLKNKKEIEVDREVVITIPISYQVTEDKWERSYLSKKLKETDTIKDILDFVKSNNGDIGTLIVTEITDLSKKE